MERRKFLKKFAVGTISLSALPLTQLNPKNYIYHSPLKWQEISEGLEFSKTNVYYEGKVIDSIACLKINPEKNKFRVFNGYSKKNLERYTIQEWQKLTKATAMINGGQYMEEPFGMPCSLTICDGEQKGPKYNQNSRGMFLAEPKQKIKEDLLKADLIDFQYDKFDYKDTVYTQGIQHWPILLDRNNKIKVNQSNLKSKRSVIAKTNNKDILFLKTEKNYFSLYELGNFLKDSNQRKDKGFNIHTAMNLDGSFESNMIIITSKFIYDPKEINKKLPGVVGVFPRKQN